MSWVAAGAVGVSAVGGAMGKKGGGGSAPEYPDPEVVAAAQTKSAKDTAIWNSALNNVNQITPYGSLSYTLGSAQGEDGPPTYDRDAYNQAMQSYSGSGMGGDLYVDKDGNITTQQFGDKTNPGAYNRVTNELYQEAVAKPELSDFQTGGSTINSQYGDLPQWTSRVELSPEMQKIFDSQMRQQDQLGGLAENALGQVENAYSTPYSYDNLNPIYGSDDLDGARQRTEEALYSRLNPQFDRDEEALRTRLINQGIGQNSEAYNNEFDRFNEMKNDARMQAVLAGGQESDQLFGQSIASRQQGINEIDKLRSQPLNEYLAMSGQQQVTNPQFQQYSYQGAATPDIQGLYNQQYQSQLSNYNANQASADNTSSALFGLGGQLGGSFLGSQAGSAWLAGLSDIRAKENIIEVGEKNGHKIFEFNYKGLSQKFRGVMAQLVQKVMPEAVIEKDGLLMVDYEKLGFPMEAV